MINNHSHIFTHKHDFFIKPCPWCNETPNCYLPSLQMDTGEAWIWFIQCENPDCTMKPKTSGIAVRKTCKYNLGRQIHKLKKLINWWNTGNPLCERDKTVVNFEIDLNKMEECEQRYAQFNNGFFNSIYKVKRQVTYKW